MILIKMMGRCYAATCLLAMLTFVMLAFKLAPIFEPDISWAGIKLRDCNAVQEVLGDIKQYTVDDSIAPAKGYIFIDDSLSEYIRLVHYPGDFICQFSRIETGSLRFLPQGKFAQHKRFKNLTSESGVAIGMSMAKLTKIKGPPMSVTKQADLTIYNYKLDQNSAFVRQNKEAGYTAQFYFENNVLVKYDFGFEYP